MARPAGVRNQDFEVKRQVLLERLTNFVLSDDAELPSFRQLSIAAEVSEPTLRHYFKDRSGVISAILEHMYEISGFMREAISAPGKSIGDGLAGYHELLQEFRNNTRFIAGHAFAIRESMSDATAREAYLRYILIPSLDAVAERLVRTKGGPTNYQTARAAGVMLMSSSLMMILHQELLDGRRHMPLDVEQYFGLVRNWIRDGLEANPEGLDRQPG